MRVDDHGEPGRWARRAPWFFLAILIFAGLCRLYQFNAPPVDFAHWRETQTLMMARNFYRDSMNPFRPAVDWRTTDVLREDGTVGGTEFPFVPWPTALLYHLFGTGHWVGRVAPLIYSLSGLAFFYLLVRRFAPWPVPLASTLLLAVSPMHLYFGRVQMPESFAFAISFATLYFFDRWLESGRRRAFWIAATASALMLLAKPQMGVMAIPMAALAFHRWGWGLFAGRQVYQFAAVTALPFLAYFAYAYLWLIPRAGLSFATNELFRFELLRDPAYYAGVARTAWHLAVEPVVCLLAAVGLFAAVFARAGRTLAVRTFFPHAWLLGALALFALMPGAAQVNAYYAMILAPPACLLAGHTLGTAFRHRILRWGAAAALTVAVWHNLDAAAKCFEPADNGAYRCGTWVRENTPTDALVLTSVANPATLYFSDRTGWTCWRQRYGEEIVFDRALVEQVHSLGADVVAVPDGAAFDAGEGGYGAVRDYLLENFRAHRGDGFVVFFLDEGPGE